MIEVKNLGKNFGELVAVRDVSLGVQAGEIFGLLQHAIPSGWTMNALHQLVSFRAGWTSGISALILLSLGTLLLGTLATRAFRYQ